jgi:hypothetical protein
MLAASVRVTESALVMLAGDDAADRVEHDQAAAAADADEAAVAVAAAAVATAEETLAEARAADASNAIVVEAAEVVATAEENLAEARATAAETAETAAALAPQWPVAVEHYAHVVASLAWLDDEADVGHAAHRQSVENGCWPLAYGWIRLGPPGAFTHP